MLLSFCASACVSGIHMYMCVYMCEGQRFTLGAILSPSTLYLLRQSSSLNLELTD